MLTNISDTHAFRLGIDQAADAGLEMVIVG
jgi:hypothetical protein